MNVDQFLKCDISRRQFLGRSAQNAAGMAAGMVGLSGAVAKSGPNERVRVGVIGVRNQGSALAGRLASFADVDVIALCDVDPRVVPQTREAVVAAQGFAPRIQKDFRRLLDSSDLDAVVVATPDHWHALMTIMACQAGKDVYLEKPIAHTVVEGTRIVAAAKRYDRVVQVGLQQRSGSHFQSAVELVRSGELGKVRLARAWTVHRRKSIGSEAACAVPDGVDYDLWLGPAPARPFQANRFHHHWRWFWDYGTGELGNWGVHMLDVARWGLDVDLPTRISATGGKYCFRDDQQTPDTLHVHYAFADKTIVWEHRQWSDHGLEGRSAAVAFYGERGTLIVDRGGWKVYDTKRPATSDASEQLRTHLRNFIDCIKSRQSPTVDVATAAVSTALCHLGNIAYRLGREVRFDPVTSEFGTDAPANALLTRSYRPEWELPRV